MTAIQYGDFFAVDPKKDCPHIAEHVITDASLYMPISIDCPCGVCDISGENWICLKCQGVFCSRYIGAHMLEHGEAEQHHINLSFSDLSFNCYACDSYIISPVLHGIRDIFYDKKFGDGATAADALSQLTGQQEKMEEEKKEEEPAPEQPKEDVAEALSQLSLTGNEESKKEEEPAPEQPKKNAEEAKKILEETKEAKEEVKEQEKLYFDDRNIEELAERLKRGWYKNVCIMAGAGISVSAGIPDFRSPGSGLYDQLEKYNLPAPEAVFEIGFFKKNPEPFFKLSQSLYGDFKPTPTHYFIKLLEDKGLLMNCFTQNIDGLEEAAGVTKFVQAHGGYSCAHCTKCKRVFPQDKMLECIKTGTVAICEHCGGYAKPDVVFFGENLPVKFFTDSMKVKEADLLIVMGTSLVVFPFAALVHETSKSCPRVLINRDLSGDIKPEGENKRDMFLQGDSDATCLKIMELAGWMEDYNALQATDN